MGNDADTARPQGESFESGRVGTRYGKRLLHGKNSVQIQPQIYEEYCI
jgi:hypothetical protein